MEKHSFKDFIRASSSLFKIPYWVILLLGAIYFLFIIGYGEAEPNYLMRFFAFLIVVGISYWDWRRKMKKTAD